MQLCDHSTNENKNSLNITFSIVSKDAFHFWKMRNAAVNVGFYVKTKQNKRYSEGEWGKIWSKVKAAELERQEQNVQDLEESTTRSSKTKYLTTESRRRTWGTYRAACFYSFYSALLVLCEFIYEHFLAQIINGLKKKKTCINQCNFNAILILFFHLSIPYKLICIMVTAIVLTHIILFFCLRYFMCHQTF